MLAVTAMLSVQLGCALSINVNGDVGPAGTAWLRLGIAGLIFLAIARPPLRMVAAPCRCCSASEPRPVCR